MATVTKTDSALDGRPEDSCYEVVKGKVVELSPMSVLANRVRSRIYLDVATFARQNELGEADTEMLFLIDEEEDNERRPDVSFVSYDRWPRDRDITNEAAWNVVPDLAVEVVSPTDRAEDALGKIHEYFESGVLAVWVIYPNLKTAYIYNSPTSVRVILRDGELDGGEILPGFRLAMAKLFEGLSG